MSVAECSRAQTTRVFMIARNRAPSSPSGS